MKFLATLFVTSFLSISIAACAKEEPKKSPVVAAPVVAAPVVADPVVAAPVVAAPVVAAPVVAAPVEAIKKPTKPTTKRVCVDIQGRNGKPVIDPKTKKPRQDCKNITVREKFQGTKIQDAKKK